jgi:hypothetical protein
MASPCQTNYLPSSELPRNGRRLPGFVHHHKRRLGTAPCLGRTITGTTPLKRCSWPSTRQIAQRKHVCWNLRSAGSTSQTGSPHKPSGKCETPSNGQESSPSARVLSERYTSTLATSAFCSMNARRGSTLSPISSSKRTFASSISLTLTCSSERALVSSVVSQS